MLGKSVHQLLSAPPTAGGCDDITCCEATCATYKHCRERRAEPDPKKATLVPGTSRGWELGTKDSWISRELAVEASQVCGLTANKCNDDLCCEKRGQLRRNERRESREARRNGHYGHYAYEPGAAKLIDTEDGAKGRPRILGSNCCWILGFLVIPLYLTTREALWHLCHNAICRCRLSLLEILIMRNWANSPRNRNSTELLEKFYGSCLNSCRSWLSCKRATLLMRMRRKSQTSCRPNVSRCFNLILGLCAKRSPSCICCVYVESLFVYHESQPSWMMWDFKRGRGEMRHIKSGLWQKDLQGCWWFCFTLLRFCLEFQNHFTAKERSSKFVWTELPTAQRQ